MITAVRMSSLGVVFSMLFLVFIPLLSAQELVLQQPVELKNSGSAFSIINEQNQKVCLVLLDNKGVEAYLLNPRMQVEKHLSFADAAVMNLLNTPVGNFYNGDSYVMVVEKSRTKNSYLFLEIDFDKEKISFRERWNFSIPPSDELLATFSAAGKFFALTAIQEPNALRLFVLDTVGVPKITAFDVPQGIVLSDANKYTKDLHRYLSDQKTSRTIEFEKMPDDASAASLTTSVKRHKAYYRNDSLLLTIDNIGSATHLLTLDLNAKTLGYKKIDYPPLPCAIPTDIKPQGNSFLYENYLFQIKSCPSCVKIGIRNFLDISLLQEYQFTGRDTAIAFKNTPILLKMERTNKDAKEKALTKPLDVLEKIDEYNVMISAWKNRQGQLEMTVGAHMLYIPSSGGGSTFMPGMPGISTPFGAVPGTAGTWRFNPTYGSFRNSGLNRTVAFKSLLSTSGEHLAGDTTPNSYDQLQEAIEKQFNEKEFKAETVFYFNNAFYFGTYNKDTKQFSIYRYGNK